MILERPLNEIELLMLQRSRMAPWDPVLSAAVPFRIRGLTEAAMERGVAALAAARPIARAQIHWDGEGALLSTREGQVPEIESLGIYEEDQLARAVETVLNRPPSPLFFKVYYAPIRDTEDMYAVFAGRQPFGDYLTMIELVIDFVRAAGGETLEPIDELPPSMGDVIPAEAVEEAERRTGPLLASGLVCMRPVEMPLRVEQSVHAPSTLALYASLSEEETLAFLARARAKGVSATSVVSAAFAMAAATEARPRPKFQIPMSLRAKLDRDLRRRGGQYTSIACIAVEPGKRDIFEIAAEIGDALKAYTASLADMLVPLAAVGRLMREQMAGGDSRFSLEPSDFSVQNGGKLEVPERVGDIEILRVPTGMHVEEDERAATMHTFRGRLELGASTRGFAYSRAEMTTWFDRAITLLLQS